jgi:transposase-like protein
MANPPLDPSVLQATVDAIHQHGGSLSAAAQALGIPRGTIYSRMAQAERAGLAVSRRVFAEDKHAVPVAQAFTAPDLPSELPTAEELLARRTKQFARKKDAKDSRHLIPVRVQVDGPVGIAVPGDPHLDDDGTDIAMVERHVQLFRSVEALFAIGIGDNHNNWIGRLARLYGQQGLSAAEALILVEWYVRAVPWLAMLGGNHDLWSGAGDPTQWMAKQARVLYEAHGARIGLQFPNGREIRINARHDFSGKSQWNTAHGPAKAAQLGWRDHILVAGHLHTSGYNVVRDPATGLLSHCVRTGSYKTYDRYAEEKGLPNQTFTVCPVFLIDPEHPDDSARCITVYFDPEEAADVLTFKRKKWARKRSA